MIDAVALAVAAIRRLSDIDVHVDSPWATLEVRWYASGAFYAELSHLHRFFPLGCAHPDVRHHAGIDVCRDCFEIVKYKSLVPGPAMAAAGPVSYPSLSRCAEVVGAELGDQDNREAVTLG